MQIKEKAIGLIASKSEGHPYVMVSMCYIIFDSLLEAEKAISEETMGRAVQKIKQA